MPLFAPVGWEICWARPAIQSALQLISGCNPGVVIGTGPPHTDVLVATKVAARAGWPLILDYRDPWTAYPWAHESRFSLTRSIAARLERQCVMRSAARVFNTPEMKEHFEQYFPEASRSANHVVPNGVAPAREPDSAAAVRNEIVYAGELYMDRTLLPVLRALRYLRTAHASHRDLRLVMYGSTSERHQASVRSEGLESLLEIRGRVSQSQLSDVLRNARALLVVSGSEASYAIPNKVYDYLSSGRPILALTPPATALHRFAQEIGSIVSADPSDDVAVRQACEKVLATVPVEDHRTRLEPLLWPTLASSYLRIVDSVWPRAAQQAAASTTRLV